MFGSAKVSKSMDLPISFRAWVTTGPQQVLHNFHRGATWVLKSCDLRAQCTLCATRLNDNTVFFCKGRPPDFPHSRLNSRDALRGALRLQAQRLCATPRSEYFVSRVAWACGKMGLWLVEGTLLRVCLHGNTRKPTHFGCPCFDTCPK